MTAVAVPCGSHELATGDPCPAEGSHPNALQGLLLCELAPHDQALPHFDPLDGHWRVTELGVTELSRCQRIVSAS